MLDTPQPTPDTVAEKTRLRRDWMIVGIASFALVIVAGAITWWDNVTFPGTGHSHGISASVGEPGNPALPAQVVEVSMIEDDSGMKFVPALINVTVGDQVRFRIINKGMLDHEFVLATLADNLAHLEAMKRFPDMVHGSANAITLKPDASGEILWHFTRAGTFDFSCLIPGHREAGMHGSVVVK